MRACFLPSLKKNKEIRGEIITSHVEMHEGRKGG